MQRLLLIIFASFFLCISCKKSSPAGILSTDKMVDLLVEVHLIDGYLNGLQIDSSRRVIDALYGQLFEKNSMDSLVFKQNMDYYLGNPMLAKDIYAKVNTKLTGIERKYHIADSIQNAHYTDSLMSAQRYVRLKEEAEKLIMDVAKGVYPLDYRNSAEDFMRRAGLTVNMYGQNMPLAMPLLPNLAEPEGRLLSEPLPELQDTVRRPKELLPKDAVQPVQERPTRPSRTIRR